MLNWYLQNGKESDVVVSSRIRLGRNLVQFPFETKDTPKQRQAILDKMEEIVGSIGYGLKLLKLKDMDDITKMSLVEKHLISPEFAMKKDYEGGILVNEDENISIMINEEDHLRLQVFSSGLELENLLNLAIEIDEKIGTMIDYAYNEQYGFLTACPTNIGTAMRASIMVHLPALNATGNIGKILQIMNNFGMSIRGVYGEGSEAGGDMYQVSNKQCLGLSEKEIIKNLKLITDKIIEQERLARKYLCKNGIEFEDKLYRNFGILSSCRKISTEESRDLISKVKVGTDLGIIKEVNDLKIKKLELYTKPANLQKFLGKRYDGFDRDVKRAEVIKQIIKE